MLGRPDAAASGELVEFLAGDASAIAEVEPICRAFAARIVPLPGPAGAANNQKLCVNFFLAAVIEAMGECFTLGDCLGVSREALRFMFAQSFAMPALKSYAERLYARDADGSTGFAMTAGLKDLRLIREAAEGANCRVEIADAIAAKMEAAIAEGMAGRDLQFGSGNHAQTGGAGRQARGRLAGGGAGEAATLSQAASTTPRLLAHIAGAVPP